MIAGDKRLAPRETGEVRGGSITQRREPREITSAELFGGWREIHIRHADGLYTLRLTARGKLILTK